jgi:hypothetical protein
MTIVRNRRRDLGRNGCDFEEYACVFVAYGSQKGIAEVR